MKMYNQRRRIINLEEEADFFKSPYQKLTPRQKEYYDKELDKRNLKNERERIRTMIRNQNKNRGPLVGIGESIRRRFR